MSKYGEEKTLTKQIADEATLKCPILTEETNKVGEIRTEMVDNNALIICDVHTIPKLEDKRKATPIRTRIELKRNRLGKIMPKLYNLDDCLESEKPVKIDLDLDLFQMEGE